MKIVCASICKNEEHNIPNFLLNLRNIGITQLFVIDTLSTDNSVGLLTSATDINVFVKSVEINPFDFSKARNYLIDLIPNDVDFVLHLDFDERVISLPLFLETGSAYSCNRKEMLYGTTSQYITKLTPGIGWFWKYPIHEELIFQPILHDDNFVIEHYQRPDKDCYESLTELYFESNPERLYFHRLTDLIHNSKYQEYIDLFKKYRTWVLTGQQRWLAVKNYETSLLKLNKPADPAFFNVLEEANSSSSWYYLFLCHDSIEDYGKAIECWNKANRTDFEKSNEIKFYNKLVKDRAFKLFNNKKEIYENWFHR